MFRWHDPVSDTEVLVLYHRAQHDTLWEVPLASPFNTYGGFTRADNTLVTRTGTAFASFIGADNTGPPQSAFEVRRGQIYEKKDERRFRFFSRRRP